VAAGRAGAAHLPESCGAAKAAVMRPTLTVTAALILSLAACVAPKGPPRQTASGPASPPVDIAAPPIGGDWRDVALTPGTWIYQPGKDGSIAAYAVAGRPAVFTVRCEMAGRSVALQRPGAAGAGTATLTTSYGERKLATGAILDGIGWRMAARDPVLDQIAFSRGRFVVEGIGPRLVLPAWAEIARVIEDCRG
jgi:hypothetical protein